MAPSTMPTQRLLKKRRVDDGAGTIAHSSRGQLGSPLGTLQRDVSPPAKLRAKSKTDVLKAHPIHNTEDEDEDEECVQTALEPKETIVDDDVTEDESEDDLSKAPGSSKCADASRTRATKADKANQQSPGQATPTGYISSPVQLTRIRDLPPSHNVDTVSLHDILGHPLLKECWQFNYLLSIPFILQHFDPDIRSLISLKIVHGFWRNDDTRKKRLQEQAEAAMESGAQVQLIAAHMPEMFGTHHSKLMILIRHDGFAQIVIHTANMIEQDWTNLAQAVWRSPLLPLLPDNEQQENGSASAAIGSGLRFKADLLWYLRAYSSRTRNLVEELKKYDFRGIRAALIASTPSKTPLGTSANQLTTAWGWPGLKEILSEIPATISAQSAPIINLQISSIATLTDKWIQNFLTVLDSHAKPAKTSLGSKSKPKYNIIFPTAAEVRTSLNGYVSGSSIHMKLQSTAQQKQLQLLKPMLCHWDSTASKQSSTGQHHEKREALRNRAAPHIKTYIRFKDSSCKEIDWAMITSANLSQQAWGSPEDKSGVVRTASYEIGVVVWPELFKENDGDKVFMIPTFGKDTPASDGVQGDGRLVMGLRMPYDLPLVPYSKEDMPWCAAMSYQQPDWMGRLWGGHDDRK